MWKNQIFYKPFNYGQYVDNEGRIHNVEDDYSLYSGNETIISYEYRNTTINPVTGKLYILNDSMMNARYNGYSMAFKALAFVPCITIFICFGVFIAKYGRYAKPTSENPYAGRLRKRRRHKFSARKKWNSFRVWVRGAGPFLTRFRKRQEETIDQSDQESKKEIKDESVDKASEDIGLQDVPV